MSIRRVIIVSGVAFGSSVLVALHAGEPPPTSSREAPFVLSASEHRTEEEFEQRVREYRTLQRKLEDTLPALPKRATPQQVDDNQRALGALIKNARSGAKRGEFFTAGMESLVKRILARVMGGSDGKTIKASIMDENPGMPNLAVNDRYPDSIPLSTMPPEILKALPKLEEDLEYRFIGERLVLMDPRADVVIDFTANVLP